MKQIENKCMLITYGNSMGSNLKEMEEILEKHYLELVKDGADGLQIDKVCVGSFLDFNPLNTEKPDVAMCEGLVQSMGRMLEKCRRINPDFCFGSEFAQDRLIPYIDVGYRNTFGFKGISPMHYVFPEWTACQHVSSPYDYAAVNAAVMTGAVICMEPFTYQGSMDHPVYRKLSAYIQEAERNRGELKDILFLVIGAALIAVGADLLVDNATAIATGLGVSEKVIGLTIVA